MTAYQVMPGLTAEEYASLREDIALHGVRVPVDVDENGQVLDGHHRSLIAAELGLDCPRRVIEGLTEAEKVAHALAVNVHRRNLTREQRRELIAASLRAEPEASDVEHARRTGVSDKTVADQRRQMEGRSEIPNVESRTDTRGRQQPASKPAKVTETTRESTSVKTEYEVDTETGEITDPTPMPRRDAPPTPAPNPIGEAVKAARSGPAYIAGNELERIFTAVRGIEQAGGPAAVARDLGDSDLDRKYAESLLTMLDRALPVLTDLRARLGRRNLRSVQ